MATAAPPHVSTFEQRARRRRLEHYRAALGAPDVEQRLGPLAQHMVQNHRVRACGYASAPLRQLDLIVLREALSRLLCDEWEQGHLIVQVVVEAIDPAQVAAGRGVSRAVLVDQLRDAVDKLAVAYEHLAYAGAVETHEQRMRARLAGKRG